MLEVLLLLFLRDRYRLFLVAERDLLFPFLLLSGLDPGGWGRVEEPQRCQEHEAVAPAHGDDQLPSQAIELGTVHSATSCA
jgi:hypothetical protein